MNSTSIPICLYADDVELEEHELPPMPEPPDPESCCKNACSPCVHDIHERQLDLYCATIRRLKQQKARSKHSSSSYDTNRAASYPCRLQLVKSNDHTDAGLGQQPTGDVVANEGFVAPILDAQVIAGPNERHRDIKTTVLLELGLDAWGELHSSPFVPGDYVAIRPANASVAVESLLHRLKLNGADRYMIAPSEQEDNSSLPVTHHIRGAFSVADAFRYLCDISSPASKPLLHMLAHFADDDEDKEELLHLCGKEAWQREFYQKNIVEQRVDLLELLKRYPSCNPPLSHLLDHLPPQRERYYSIASSPLLFSDRVHIVFPVVEYTTPPPQKRSRRGVCTSWMHEKALHLAAGRRSASGIHDDSSSMKIWIKRTADFVPPSDITVPLIMVCAGAGIAPFRSFLQHRRESLQNKNKKYSPEHLQKAGPCWLFFGCRYEDDFLFKEEMEQFVREGVLSKLVVAFSRAASSSSSSSNAENSKDLPRSGKVYVQDKLLHYGREIFTLWMEQNAIVYVCGDASGMGCGVREALEQILSSQCSSSSCSSSSSFSSVETPSQVLQRLERDKRFLQDLWTSRNK